MFLSAWVSTQDRERSSSMAAPLLCCVLWNDVPLCPKGQWDFFFFLHHLLHREMDEKDGLSFRCFLKLLLEVTLCDKVQRHGFLLGAENICVGLMKGGAVAEASCTFEHHCKSPLVTYTACGGNCERRWDFRWSLCSQSGLQRLLCALHHWLPFPRDRVPMLALCYDLLFLFTLLFFIFPIFISAFLAFTHQHTRIPSPLKIAGKITTPRRALLGTQQGGEPMLEVVLDVWFSNRAEMNSSDNGQIIAM